MGSYSIVAVRCCTLQSPFVTFNQQCQAVTEMTEQCKYVVMDITSKKAFSPHTSNYLMFNT